MAVKTVPPDAPPALVWSLTEISRALCEYAWFASVRPLLARRPGSTGHPVLVLPGLMADDRSTGPLRRLLTAVGYTAYPWGLGTDIGPTGRIISGLDALLADISARHGTPVSLVGQSLGGILARDLARRHPGAVDRIVTLGSPVAMSSGRQSRADRTYRRYADRHLPEYAFERWIAAPEPSVPSTSIYSRCDGVVRWEACRLPESPRAENIEVLGSHLGLAVHPAAVYAVLDRLAVPVAQWAPFRPPAPLRLYYPTSRPEHTARSV